MSPLPDLDELDSAAEMIDHRLIASRVPPFDGHIVLAAGGDDPKRNGFTRDLVDLREPGFLLRGQVNVSFEQVENIFNRIGAVYVPMDRSAVAGCHCLVYGALLLCMVATTRVPEHSYPSSLKRHLEQPV